MIFKGDCCVISRTGLVALVQASEHILKARIGTRDGALRQARPGCFRETCAWPVQALGTKPEGGSIQFPKKTSSIPAASSNSLNTGSL
ncbi:hypothetical protein Q3G72_022362 [Acer saccharum]|nr:hypothetical protein Q3G72_022362 [Acer saccharum]